MNRCRECGVNIPDKYKWSQALWCSNCRKLKDEEIKEIIKLKKENKKLIKWAGRLFEQIAILEEEVEYLRNRLALLENNQ